MFSYLWMQKNTLNIYWQPSICVLRFLIFEDIHLLAPECNMHSNKLFLCQSEAQNLEQERYSGCLSKLCACRNLFVFKVLALYKKYSLNLEVLLRKHSRCKSFLQKHVHQHKNKRLISPLFLLSFIHIGSVKTAWKLILYLHKLRGKGKESKKMAIKLPKNVWVFQEVL